MATLYRVRNWSTHFENNRTRELKHMDWVPVPNRMDGDGYTELLDHPEGASHFGAWIAIVEVASRCDPRGTLLRDGAEGSKPHDPASLSRVTRISARVFGDALPRLVSIGWLTSEVVVSTIDTQIPQDDAARSHEGAPAPQGSDYGTERNGTEGNGTEENTRPLSASADVGGVRDQTIRPAAAGGDTDEPAGFLTFWDSWPKHFRKKGRAKCRRKWRQAGLERISDQVISCLGRCKASAEWSKQGGQFIPLPMSWLNDTPWETDPAEMVEASEPPEGDDRFSPGFVPVRPGPELLREIFGTEAPP